MNSADHDVLRTQLASLRVVWLNGEVVPTSLLEQALGVFPSSTRVFNTYSISETHDVCTIELTGLRLDGMEVCPVGLPMDGVAVRVLPEGESALASTGVGELFIGGRGLARGTLGGRTWTPNISFGGTERGTTQRAIWPRLTRRG